jgi:SpoVK/Ycf46/Vps4 family AAA+-type ATPase
VRRENLVALATPHFYYAEDDQSTDDLLQPISVVKRVGEAHESWPAKQLMPNVLFTIKTFDEARDRLYSPSDTFDALVDIGAYHFEFGISDFAKWCDAVNATVRTELGRHINRPILEEAYVQMRGKAFKAAQHIVKTSISKRPDVAESLNRFMMIEKPPSGPARVLNTAVNQGEAATATKSLGKDLKSTASQNLSAIIGLERQDELKKLVGDLDALIGLHRVKADVAELTNYIVVSHERKSRGFKVSDASLHMVFFGNPGTGKTTVARLISQIYKVLGVLSKGHLVEASRSDLVGGYLGQTAIKTTEKVEEALGGILFIDEAYSLVPLRDGFDSFGREALDTLVKLMEDNRDDLAVIVAGYPEDMRRFLAANPGLQSRFNKFLSFDDYEPPQLLEIFEYFCVEADYRLDRSVRKKLMKLFELAYMNRDTKRFGNAREARNVFDQTIKNLANRVVTLHHLENDTLSSIQEADVPDRWPISAGPLGSTSSD